MATTEWEEGEWELVNDDGFVYKRKKRQRLDPTAADTSVPPPPDPEAEEESRRERKKRALTKLRDKYQKEIDKWELLSNMLKSLEGKAQHQQRQHQLHEQTMESSSEALATGLPAPSQNSSEPAARRVLDNLLLRVGLVFFILGFHFEALDQF